jgi:predicted nucleotidyltransferase
MTAEQIAVTVSEVVARLVDYYHPLKIYLFGSAARRDIGPDSDLDFLVVLPDDAPRSYFGTGDVYSTLGGLRVAVDVVPWRKSDFECRAAYVVASLPATVLREGQLVYDAESFPHR